MARGKPLTHIQIDKALSFVALGHTLSQIADEIGCHPTALNRVLLGDYSEEYEAAKDRKRDKLRKIQWDVGTDPEHKDFRFFHDKLSLVHLPEYREATRAINAPNPEEERSDQIAEALERFAAAVVQAVAAGPAELVSGDPQ